MNETLPEAAALSAVKQLSPIRANVLVDLDWTPQAGGHVKCWERLTEAAAGFPELVDITVHFRGPRRRAVSIAPNVRFMVHPSGLSTRWLPFLGGAPDHTDLAPLSPGLLPHLLRCDVIHTTDAFFAFARTARLAARISGTPLVYSMHTDTPAYARIYAESILRRAGGRLFGPLLVDRWRLPERVASRMEKRQVRHTRRCAGVLAATWGDTGTSSRRARLRRGIDRDRFHPGRRNRSWLTDTFGVPEDALVLVSAGRISAGKSVMTLAAAARTLIDQGWNIHVVLAGEGAEAAAFRRVLDAHCTLPGVVDQDTLARIEASADIFVFPSRVEISPNAVLEAKAAGLPAIVDPQGGGTYIVEDGVDGVVVADPDPAAWAAAIEVLARDPGRRAAIGRAARREVEQNRPSWSDVLIEDLIPVWRAAVARDTAESPDRHAWPQDSVANSAPGR